MNNMIRTVITVLLLLLLLPLSARGQSDTTYIFRFMPQRDMFYVPYEGNGAELSRLLDCVERHKPEILSGDITLYVDGYSSAGLDEADNLRMSRIRSNRVKSELITAQGLTEDCFITRNHSGGGDCVTVRMTVPAAAADIQRKTEPQPARPDDTAADTATTVPADRPDDAGTARREQTADRTATQPESTAETATYSPHWYAGIQGGAAFGLGELSSFGADGATPGWSAGIYAGYSFNPVLSLELRAAWGQLVMNRRGCSPDYWLGSDGNRYEATVAGMDGWHYSALQSHVFAQRYAAQLNVNLLGFFRKTKDSRWTLDLSPHIEAAGTKAERQTDDGKDAMPADGAQWHFGAGADVQASYTFAAGFRLGIYTGMTYLTGEPVDGMPRHLHKANCIWESGLKLGWNFGTKGKENRR